ncbi:WD40 repeat domain-containing protein, partial [Endozoicomonas numazuensis]|uniref:WD40 repeat domain-containing protein n=1 Tax=Endozoicomonas numazuensis TaxID=1137799 RepID=UPI001377F00F
MITKLVGLMGLMLSVLASISHGATEGSGNPENVRFIPGPVIKFNATELMEIDEENNAYGPQTFVSALRFKPDGSELIMVGYAKNTGAIPVRTFIQRFNTSALPLTQKSVNRLGHDHIYEGSLLSVSISSGGGFIVYTTGITLYSYKASPVRYTYLYEKALEAISLFATTFILEDAWLVYGHDRRLSLINPASKDDVLPLPGEFPEAVSALDSQGLWLASGDQSGEIRVHNLTNLSDVSYVEMPAHSDDVLSLGFSPDGDRLLSGGNDNLARLWLREAEGHFTLIQNMTFDADARVVLYHPDGEHYAVAEGPRVHLYEAAHQTRLDTLTMA